MKHDEQNHIWIKEAMEDREKTRLIASVVHVSKSGMSRRIAFGLIHNNELLNITYYIAQLTGWKMKDDGVVVKGCGMDMIFHTLDTAAHKLGVKDFHQRYRMI